MHHDSFQIIDDLKKIMLHMEKLGENIERTINDIENIEQNYSSKNKEKIELECLQYRKYMNEPENIEDKIQTEKETAEWLGQSSYTIDPLTEEEEKRLEYLKKLI